MSETVAGLGVCLFPDLAMTLNNQSGCLSELGRREDALAAIDEAVTIRRKLTAARPHVFSERLVSSLRKRADILDSLGRGSEADQARAEAAGLQVTDPRVPRVTSERPC